MTKLWKLKNLAPAINIVVFTALSLSKVNFQALITLTNHIVAKLQKILEGVPMRNNKESSLKSIDVLRNIVAFNVYRSLSHFIRILR